MITIAEAAEELAKQFFQAGFFPAASGAMDSSAMAISSQENENETFQEINVFSGIPIQCMGYSNDKIMIYANRVSNKSKKEIPGEYKGHPISLNRLGSFQVKPEISKKASACGHVFQRGDRFCCGSSAAPSSASYAGTFGAIVKDGDDVYYALSNNHIFGDCNHMPVGMPILIPSAIDAKPKRPAPTAVCFHDRICELRSGIPGLVDNSSIDAAIAIIQNHDLVSSWQGTESDGYDTPTTIEIPESEMRVKKCGRTTGVTTGVIESKVSLFPIDYKSKKFSATVWLSNVWIIRGDNSGFALPGDSGSLVVTENGSAAVGLLFASNNAGDVAWMYPLSEVCNSLGIVSLVGSHNV